MILFQTFMTAQIRLFFKVTDLKINAQKFFILFNVMLLYFAIELIIVFFCLLVFGIRKKLKMLEKALKNLQKNELKLNFLRKLEKCEVSSLSKLYLNIFEINRGVNWIFGMPISLFVMFNLLTMTFAIFELYLMAVSERTNAQFEICVLTNLWTLITGIFLFFIF